MLWWGPGPKPGPHTVVISEGATLGTVARKLEKAGAIPGTAETYYVMARVLGSHDPIQAGEFEIPKGMGGAAILDLLQHGKPVQRLITVTEGMPSIIVSEKLAANPYLAGPTPPIRGRIGAARQLRLSARRDARVACRSACSKRWLRPLQHCGRSGAPIARLRLPEQAVILASIVEKETGKAE